MASFIGTWNPNDWSWEDNGYASEIATTAAGGTVSENWSMNLRRAGVSVGDRCYIHRLNNLRGIVASGYFSSPIYMGPHYDGSARQQAMADVDFDMVLRPEDRLPVEELKLTVPQVPWDRLQGSGVQVNPLAEITLEELWQEHLGSLGWRSPEEETSRLFSEGEPARVSVNRYERDPKARQACIDHWGTNCQVCGLDFEAMYGPIGRDFTHVHHLDPLGSIAKAHDVDPVNDLRPVCPNCHSMLHTFKPPIDVAVLEQEVASRRRNPRRKKL